MPNFHSWNFLLQKNARLLCGIRFSIFCILSIIISSSVHAQKYKHPSTYALIVGISDYENEGIQDLDFAHRDAEIFAGYLQSKAGGSVPAQNITLLLNQDASHTAIYHALDWLSDSCKTNDTVYIYFSGHGDVENTDVYKQGFLLTQNSPRLNYLNFSLSVEDLNFYANYLSIQTKAKVILITDACHAGVLAGNEIKGKYLVGDQLKKVLNNEVRLNSCTTDQLSNEDKDWGGGRGVFSFYLLNGLMGFADKEGDKKVSLLEIRNYLDSSLRKDPILKSQLKKQTPIIEGNEDLILAKVDAITFTQLLKDTLQEIENNPAPTPAYASFFKALEDKKLEDVFNLNQLDSLSKDEIPNAMINMLIAYDSNENESMAKLKIVLKQNPDANRRFADKLVDLLDKTTQNIIELYLNGDEAELERRRYYSMLNSNYDIYPKMLSIACKLSNPNKPLYKTLQSKYHYFSGVVARIKTALFANPDSLINVAFNEQFKADSFKNDAAYILNELGILYHGTKKYKEADSCFTKARKIAPMWASPWANLSSVFARTNQFEKGLEYANKSIALNNKSSSAHVHLGRLYELKSNYLLAEEMYRQAIELNSRHYLPFERLAFVCQATNQYALADSLFFEADLRKKGFFIHEGLIAVEASYAVKLPPERNIKCELPSKIKEDDIITNFIAGLIKIQNKDTLQGENYLKKVIAFDKTNPLAFHELGKLFWQQKRWIEADIMFGFAKKYHLNDSVFIIYCDSVRRYMTEDDECIFQEFVKSQFPFIEDYFYHGSVLEQWQHIDEAIANYRETIKLSEQKIEGYYKLWNLFESVGRYEEAETTIKSFPDIDLQNDYLHAFYHRVTRKFPQDAAWHYKAGNFMYAIAVANPDDYKYDESKREADYDLRIDLDEDVTFSSGHIETSDSIQANYVHHISHIRESDLFKDFIPGTLEVLTSGMRVNHPFSEGLKFLKVADTFTTNIFILADIDEKIGDLYIWKGLYQKAPPYYKKAVDLQGSNAGVRIKLIDSWHANYAYSKALKQLDTLSMRGELNYEKILLKARYHIHEGGFKKADSLLKISEKYHPYAHPEMNEWKARLHFMAKKVEKALPYYFAYSKQYPQNYFTSYSIARCYAMQQNKEKAFQYLNQAISEGFRLGWVLINDAIWDSYRNTTEWNLFAAKVSPIVYHAPFVVNP